jgi:FMN phosphatase YigB (HAD superfamily)
MNLNPYLLLMLPAILILWFGVIFLMLTKKHASKKVILVDAWNTFVTETWIDKEMQKVLDRFPNKKIILTNADSEEQKELGIVDMPYVVFTLSNNPPKTDPEYYKRMLSNFWLMSQNTLYFEHNPDAMKSAESVWIKTMWFDKEKRDLGEVEKFLREKL